LNAENRGIPITRKEAKQLQQYGPQNMKCALIGNKVDLEDFRAVSKEVIRYSVLQVTFENLITGQLM
jgi:hypothetical protein